MELATGTQRAAELLSLHASSDTLPTVGRTSHTPNIHSTQYILSFAASQGEDFMGPIHLTWRETFALLGHTSELSVSTCVLRAFTCER